jgi:very-short-patch-repair endonuclease
MATKSTLALFFDFLFGGGGGSRASRKRKFFPKALMTKTEMVFFLRLKQAVPEYEVFPQVCMGAIIDPAHHLTGKYREKARWRYQSKIVDLTVFDIATSRVICLVELDDRTHDGREAQDDARDGMTSEAEYLTHRWDARSMPTASEIRKAVVEDGRLSEELAEGEGIASQRDEHSGLQPVPRGQSKPRGGIGGRVVGGMAVLLGCYFVLPASASFAVSQFMAPLVPKEYRAVVLKPGTGKFSLPSNGFVEISYPKCLAYGDAPRIKADANMGCKPGESVTFKRAAEPQDFLDWVAFDNTRVVTGGGCSPYLQWAEEIAHGMATLPEKKRMLNNLYSDALVKGCLRGLG